MNDMQQKHFETEALSEAELRELENELRRFRLSPLPPAVHQRMLTAAVSEHRRFAPRSYCRYIAPASAMVMLAVVAVSLPQVPDAPTPIYVPMLACLAGLLMLTVLPLGRVRCAG